MAEDNLPEGFVVDQPATTFSDLPEGFKIDQQRRNYLPSTLSGAISSFLEPITSYPATYSEMNKEAREQVGHGVDQLSKHESAWDVAKGAGNVALGSLGYVSSPISAGIRTIVGKPIEEATGIPKEYTEFATSLALPGIGFSRIPGAAAVPKMPTRGPLGVTLSEGQASGELPLIQREQAALRGQSGAPAHARAQEFATQQAEQLSAAKENIARGFDEFGNIIAETPQEGAGAAAQRFRSSAASAKKDVTQAYKTARDIPGEIRPEAFDNIVPTVQKTLSELPDPVIVNELTPWANKAMDLLKDKVTNQKLVNKAESSTGAIPIGEEATLSGINLNGIDQWRKQLSAMRRNSFNPQNMSDYRATSAILDAFDSHIDQAVNSGMFRGDPRAVQAWNDARAAFSDYKSTFGKQSNDPVGRVVQKVLGDRINEPASANAVADHLFGSSGINPSDLNRGVAQRFKNVLGQNSSEWSGVKQGLFSRLTEKGADLADWGPKNTADRINKFLNIDGKEMANVVYSPAERQAIQSYADLLRKIEVPQAGANWGNTGTAKVFQKIGGDVSTIIGTLLGSNAGHAVGLPWGVGEAAGIGLTKGSQMLANTIEARKISKQMPILANQMQAWSKSYIKSQKTPTPASQRMLVSAATTLDSTLRKFGTSLDQVSQGTSDETNEPPRTIPQITIHKEPSRATGGSVFDKMHAAKHMQEGGGLSSFLEGEYSGNKEGQHGGGYLGIESPTGNAGIGGQGWRENTPEGRLGRASITNVDVGHKIGDLNLTGSYRANQREIARPPAGDNTYFDPIEHSGQKFRMPNDIDKRFMLGLSKQFSDGGSVFDKMHMARKRAEGGGTDAPFNEWDAVPRNAEGIPQIRIEKPPVNEADEAQAAREAAAVRVAGNVRGAPYEPTPPSTEGKTWMMEPGKEAVQSGNYEMPPNVRLNDAGIPYNVETGEELQMARRPNVLPWTRTPYGVEWAMPKIAELAGDILNPLAVTKGLALNPGEFALGSGPIKRAVLEQSNAPTFYSALDRAVADIPQAKAPAEQWAATLANRPGVKPEEIQWRGLDQYLAGRAGQTVTKQEIADHLAGNKVEFGSVVKGGKEPFDAKRLSQLESEYSSLKQHPIDDPSFGEVKYDELIRLMNIRDQSSTDTLYSAAEQAMRNGQRAQQRGNKIAADRYFKEYEMLNRRAEKLDLEGLGLANPPKYSGYQLPGGENYSEKLLTLPNQWEAPRAAQVANEAKIKALRQEMHGTSGTNEIRAEIRSLQDANAALQKQISASPIYKSPHWDEPNPVTHMRTNERTIGNTASHHIEEVQSDWHQKGRTEGYADPDPAKRDIAARELLTAESELKKQIRRPDQSHYKEAIDNQVEFHANPERDVEFAEQWFGPEQQSAALRYMAAKREFSALAGGVPDAPFKKTWPDLTMKQALRDAVENGKDRLSWTPGEAQAKRYDLSQQVDSVHYNPDTQRLVAKRGNSNVIDQNGVPPDKLADYVGKDVARKIMGEEPNVNGLRSLRGENLKVGGEGMNEFYDKMLPKAVEKLGKAYGVKVQRGVDTTGNPVNYVDIPPAWKQEILKKGFPLFASGGSVFDKMKRASK